jgi:hypothetical protein
MLSQEATGMTITGHAMGHIVEVKINDISIETRPDQHLANQNVLFVDGLVILQRCVGKEETKVIISSKNEMMVAIEKLNLTVK